ncbi:MAG TPA: MFS transporter, partial [Pyrinomonadaceae bacterium]|nr:MFS transporter [Pyrinomonadaceae bacterium]
ESRPLRYAAFFYLYVMQGIPAGFALTAVANYLTAENTSPKIVGTFVAVVGLPWAVQFVWGPVIDLFQSSPMGRRKPWVLLSQVMAFFASLGVLLVDDPVTQVSTLAAVFFIHSVFASLQDASVDAMAISIIPETDRGRVNAFMRGGMLFGSGVGAAGMAYLIRNSGFFYAALAQSVTLLGMTAITFFIKEKSGDALLPWSLRSRMEPTETDVPRVNLRRLFAELFRGLLSSQSLRLFGAIIVVYTFLSVFIRAFSVHLIQQLKWADTSLSVLSGTYGTLGALIIILTGGVLADKIGSRKLLVIMMLIIGSFLVAFNLLARFWSDPAVTTTGLIIWYTFDPGFSVAAMPVLMALCRKGIEGSQFTTYMALVNLSDVAGAYVSGHALSWVSAPYIGLFCGGVVIAAMLVVGQTFFKGRRTEL